MEKYLPSLISLAGVVLTIGVSLWLGLAKQRNDNKSTGNSVEINLRDDLLQLQAENKKELMEKNRQIAERDEKLERRDQQLSATQGIIFTQLETITELKIKMRELEAEVQELRAELEKFNRKVYFKPDTGEKSNES